MASARDSFVAFLRRKGLKVTRPRLRILDTVLARERCHFTADDLARSVRTRARRRISRSTIYRTLVLLAESGIVRQQRIHEGITSYERMVDEEHHDHMICTECGRIIEFHSPELEVVQELVCRQHGFVPSGHVLHIRGRCARCSGSGK